MIRNTLGAAFIAGSALAIYNTDTIKPIVDEAIATAAQNIEVPAEISQNKEALQIGGSLLGLMLGVSMIAGAARRRLKKQHTIHPDVDNELNRKLSIVMDNLSQEFDKTREHDRNSMLLVTTRLGEVVQSLGKVDERLAGELSVDISALEKASSEIGNVENASQRVLEILEKIESSANTHIALNTPDGALERFTEAKEQYSNAQAQLKSSTLNAMQDGNSFVSKYPEHLNSILGAAAQLDLVVKNYDGNTQSLSQTSQQFTDVISKAEDTIITFMLNKKNIKPVRTKGHFTNITNSATSVLMAANEYVSAQRILTAIQNHHLPPLTSVDAGDDLFQPAENDDSFAKNEDGMIEVPGYGAIPANVPPTNNFD